jgi:hypothetical protein
MYKLPRWMNSKGYAARDKRLRMLSAGIDLHTGITTSTMERQRGMSVNGSHIMDLNLGGFDKLLFLKTPPMNDETARAGEDLGILWA